jgi:hypothetical protein
MLLAARRRMRASEMVRQIRTSLPGSNAWYARVAMNRLLLDQAPDDGHPHYHQSFARMERAAQERGSTYWWAPGQAAPELATDGQQPAP